MKTNEIEKKIGYVFKDKKLLERAFTHGSAKAAARENYQSLEFLGDSILDFVIAKRLMELYPDAHEGELTKLRANIVSRNPLAEEVEKLALADYLIVGKGESRQNIASQTKIKSDIFESVIGAIYLDSGELSCAENFILDKLSLYIIGKNRESKAVDYKSVLNEYASKHDLKAEYRQLEKSGAPHEPVFKFAVLLNGKPAGEGSGSTKREAQQNAAEQACLNNSVKID